MFIKNSKCKISFIYFKTILIKSNILKEYKMYSTKSMILNTHISHPNTISTVVLNINILLVSS